MSWADRLEKIISEKAPAAEVSKVSKATKSPFRHFRHSGTGGISKNNSRRYAYHFRLHNGEGGGTYLTDAVTLTAARSELLEVYSSRLALVTHA